MWHLLESVGFDFVLLSHITFSPLQPGGSVDAYAGFQALICQKRISAVFLYALPPRLQNPSLTKITAYILLPFIFIGFTKVEFLYLDSPPHTPPAQFIL